MANDYNAYVRFKTGGYEPVLGYDNILYEDQDVYSGWYRDTGWILLQIPNYRLTTFDGNQVMLQPTVTPATGTNAIPDEQADVDPRLLTWKETRLSFRQADNTVIAQFWVREIIGWSDSVPNET